MNIPTEYIFIDIYFDGACRNEKNKNYPMGVGVIAFAAGTKEKKMEIAKNVSSIMGHTNNVCEWLGLIEALNIAITLKEKLGDKAMFHVYTDSQLICNQFNGEWLLKQKKFTNFMQQAQKLANILGDSFLDLTWVRRERNTEADKLSKEGTMLNHTRTEMFFTENTSTDETKVIGRVIPKQEVPEKKEFTRSDMSSAVFAALDQANDFCTFHDDGYVEVDSEKMNDWLNKEYPPNVEAEI